MAFQHGAAERAMFQELTDERISQLEEGIRRSRAQRNDLQIVSKLPPEILGRVFTLSAAVSRLDLGYGKRHVHLGLQSSERSPHVRFNFSYVSRHWRRVAISTPEVWSIIPYSYPSWIQTCIERSRMSKISFNTLITCGANSPTGTVVVENICTHNDRIHELGLNLIMPSQEAQQLLDLLPAAGSQLHVVRVGFHATSNGEDAAELRLPSKLTTGAQLSTLEAQSCTIEWTSSYLVGLRYLTIGPFVTQPSPSEFMHTLQHMPQLMVLEVNNVFPPGPLESRTIELPHLHTLRILSIIDNLSAWLPYLSIPDNAMVELCSFAGFNEEVASEEQVEELGLSVAQFTKAMKHGEATDAVNYDSLKVSSVGGRCVALQAWSTPWPCSSPWFRSDTPQFSIKVKGVVHADLMISSIAPTLPLSSLKTLSIVSMRQIQEKTIRYNFGHITELTTIIIDCYTGSILMKALSTLGPALEGDSPKPLFPQLRYLWLHRTGPSSGDDLEDLDACLAGRLMMGKQICGVILSEAAGIERDKIEKLRGLVDIREDETGSMDLYEQQERYSIEEDDYLEEQDNIDPEDEYFDPYNFF